MPIGKIPEKTHSDPDGQKVTEIRREVEADIAVIISALIDNRITSSFKLFPTSDLFLLARQILSISKIAVVNREVELPDNEIWHKNEREFEAFCAGRNIMLQDGFVKEIKDEENKG